MEKISLRKILIIIAVIIMLVHRKAIFEFFGKVFQWFAESLDFMRAFPPGARAAIAYLTIILVVVIVFKTINKNF